MPATSSRGRSFFLRGISMTAQDVLDCIGPAWDTSQALAALCDGEWLYAMGIDDMVAVDEAFTILLKEGRRI